MFGGSQVHENGCAKKKNDDFPKEELVFELLQICRELGGRIQTENPYKSTVEKFKHILSLATYLQLNEMIHCLTILNRSAREKERGIYISTREDMANGMNMILPDKIKLTEKELETHRKLKHHFGDVPFTYLEAAVKLRLSHSSIKRQLTPLKAYQMVRDLPREGGERRQMQIIELKSIKQVQKQSMFDQMMEDWEDFQGFENVNYRT